jgi:hypothetical protein
MTSGKCLVVRSSEPMHGWLGIHDMWVSKGKQTKVDGTQQPPVATNNSKPQFSPR